MINRLFKYFASGRYDRALKLAETMVAQTLTQREMSFVIFTADLSIFFQGGGVTEPFMWIGDALKNLYEKQPEPNEFLTLLMAFEASKLFESNSQQAVTMLERAKASAKSPTEGAAVVFFIALFEMNRTEDYEKVLPLFLQARSGLEGNNEYSMYTFIRFWNEAMLAHVSNQMGQYKQSETLCRQILLHCRNLGLLPLMENIYMTMAFAFQGQGKKNPMPISWGWPMLWQLP